MAVKLRVDPNQREAVRRRLETVTTAREGKGSESSTTATRDSDIPQRDPQRFGYKGAYPRVEQDDLDKELVDRAYHEIGIFRNAVDEWAERTWGDGWRLSTEQEGWKDEADEFDEEVGIKQAFEDADKEQIRAVDGRCFLYLNLEDRNADDPSQPPEGVQGIADVQLVRNRHIEEVEWVEDREAGEEHGEFTRVKLQFLASDEAEWVHANRLIFIREFEHPDEHAKGIPRSLAWLQSVILYENIKWAAGESFFRNASPLMEIQIDEELVGDVEPSDIDDIMDDVDRLQNNEVQRVVSEGWTIETVEGSTNLTSPTAYWQVAVDSLAVDSRVPKHILTGSAAGAIQSAEQDEERFYSRVSDRRQKYPDRLIHEWYERLEEWGLGPGSVPDDLSIEWPALDEPDTVEEAEVALKRANAIQKYRDMDEPVPEPLTDYEPGEMPEHPNPEEQPNLQGPAEGIEGISKLIAVEGRPYVIWDHFNVDAEAVELPEGVNDIAREAEEAIRERFNQVAEKVNEKLEGIDDTFIVRRRLLYEHIDPDIIEDILVDLYEKAAEAGSRHVWEKVGEDFAFTQSINRRELEALAAETSKTVANTLTEHIQEVATTGAEAEDRPVVRQVGATFDMARERAETISATEAMRGYVEGEVDAFQMTGNDRARYTTKPGACEICAPLEGQVVFIEDAQVRPPQHPHCNCTLEPIGERGGGFI